ncbi:MAG TPA: pyridoxal 5'-phosphate synthase glutaminase subunit PdxT [bacterium]|nr:pyridoxal 5'-phosphate synthase glutaminase subunit PdxT [bacterium]
MARTVGVLGLQGDFARHLAALRRIHCPSRLVRRPEDLKTCDALILPGGESTTFMNLMERTGLAEAVPEFARNHFLFGTCAGLIVLATEIEGGCRFRPLGLIDLAVRRNAYGRQVDSFSERIRIPLFPENPAFEAVFIRAPKIVRLGGSTEPLGFHRDEVVLARNANVLAAAFHPELTRDSRIHDYFVRQLIG